MKENKMKTLGVLVNPIAGMGGRVGLKGTDGSEVLRRAIELGASPGSPRRAIETLKIISTMKAAVNVITYPCEMGEDACLEAGFEARVIGKIKSGYTTCEDTRNAAREMVDAGADLLLFAGGDGTARDIFDAIGSRAPVLGIPAGVKIHSAVYAVTSRRAGDVAVLFLEGNLKNFSEAEVMDIDEEAFREGVVSTRLYGYLLVPEEKRYIQNIKTGGFSGEKEAFHKIASDVIEQMNQENAYYLIGPGTTTRTIMHRLGLEFTLLGVDIVHNNSLVVRDASEHQIMEIISGNQARIVVTIIGGQGHIFGRGNQQFSPNVIRAVGRKNIIVVANKEKLFSLFGRSMLVDTGDETLNEMLSGYIRVTAGHGDYVMYPVGY